MKQKLLEPWSPIFQMSCVLKAYADINFDGIWLLNPHPSIILSKAAPTYTFSERHQHVHIKVLHCFSSPLHREPLSKWRLGICLCTMLNSSLWFIPLAPKVREHSFLMQGTREWSMVWGFFNVNFWVKKKRNKSVLFCLQISMPSILNH